MIEIKCDDQKCLTPRDCRKCLDVCSQAVFGVYPRNGRKPGKAVESWAVAPLFVSQCTGCMICAEACPQNAITVSVVQ